MTYSCFYLTAKIALSLQRFAISAPENPGVNAANLLAKYSLVWIYYIFRGLRWFSKIFFLPSKFGLITSIYLLNLPGLVRAESNISTLFVAPITNTLFVLSKPSISTSNWFKVDSYS